MKRLSVLFVGLLSAVLIFSVVGLADEAARSYGSIQFSSWIDINLTDNFSDIEIVQNSEDASGDGVYALDDGISSVDAGSVDVNVISLFNYELGASFYATNETGDLVILNDGSGSDQIIKYFDYTGEIWNGGDYMAEISDPSNVAASVTTMDSTGTQNIPSGTNYDYDVSLDLTELSQEYTGGETLDIEIAFWAYEQGL